jgi:hypothetical protein
MKTVKIAYLNADAASNMCWEASLNPIKGEENRFKAIINHPEVEIYEPKEFALAFNGEFISDLGYVAIIEELTTVKNGLSDDDIHAFNNHHRQFVGALCNDIEMFLKAIGGMAEYDEEAHGYIEFFNYPATCGLQIAGLDKDGNIVTPFTNTYPSHSGSDSYQQSLRSLIEDGDIPIYDAMSLWNDLKGLANNR